MAWGGLSPQSPITVYTLGPGRRHMCSLDGERWRWGCGGPLRIRQLDGIVGSQSYSRKVGLLASPSHRASTMSDPAEKGRGWATALGLQVSILAHTRPTIHWHRQCDMPLGEGLCCTGQGGGTRAVLMGIDEGRSRTGVAGVGVALCHSKKTEHTVHTLSHNLLVA